MIKCQECGGELTIDRSVKYGHAPPVYKCTCKKCGNIQYEYYTTCDSVVELKNEEVSEQSLW